jgi:predicted HicB family RNase H-like nuclease
MEEQTETKAKEQSVRRDTHSRGRERREDPAPQPRKVGRPKKYPKLMRVRLSIDEHEQLSNRAKDSGMSLSRYIIENALSSNGTRLQDKASGQATLMQREWAIYEVARIGNNLNQIARQLNSQRGSISSERIEHALSEVAEKLSDLRRLWAQCDSD